MPCKRGTVFRQIAFSLRPLAPDLSAPSKTKCSENRRGAHSEKWDCSNVISQFRIRNRQQPTCCISTPSMRRRWKTELNICPGGKSKKGECTRKTYKPLPLSRSRPRELPSGPRVTKVFWASRSPGQRFFTTFWPAVCLAESPVPSSNAQRGADDQSRQCSNSSQTQRRVRVGPLVESTGPPTWRFFFFCPGHKTDKRPASGRVAPSVSPPSIFESCRPDLGCSRGLVSPMRAQ